MSIPNYEDFLNEGSNDQRTIKFDHLNGLLKIYLAYQETDGYDTMKPVSSPDAELKISLDVRDGGITYYYNSSDYEEDREKLLADIVKLADKFDEDIKEALERRNFTK